MIHPFTKSCVVIPSGGGKSYLTTVLAMRGVRVFDVDWFWALPSMRELKAKRTAPGADRTNYGPENDRLAELLGARLIRKFDLLFAHHPGEVSDVSTVVPTLIVIPSDEVILSNLNFRGDDRAVNDRLLNARQLREVVPLQNQWVYHTRSNSQTVSTVMDWLSRILGASHYQLGAWSAPGPEFR